MITVQVFRQDETVACSPITSITFSVSSTSLPRFTTLINAALNTRPDVHPELKELGDMLTHGRILQDYYHTRSDPDKGSKDRD